MRIDPGQIETDLAATPVADDPLFEHPPPIRVDIGARLAQTARNVLQRTVALVWEHGTQKRQVTVGKLPIRRLEYAAPHLAAGNIDSHFDVFKGDFRLVRMLIPGAISHELHHERKAFSRRRGSV